MRSLEKILWKLLRKSLESDDEGSEAESGCNRDLQIAYNEIVMDCGKYEKTSGIALKNLSKVE